MALADIYPIVSTQFDDMGQIDTQSIQRLTSFLAERGVQGVTILKFMGETHKRCLRDGGGTPSGCAGGREDAGAPGSSAQPWI